MAFFRHGLLQANMHAASSLACHADKSRRTVPAFD
jgi:hypothetical protein